MSHPLLNMSANEARKLINDKIINIPANNITVHSIERVFINVLNSTIELRIYYP